MIQKLVQATLERLTGKCEPKSEIKQETTVESCSENTAQTNDCDSAAKAVMKQDEFKSSCPEIIKSTTVKDASKSSWLAALQNNIVARIQTLPTNLKRTVKEAAADIKSGFDAIIDVGKKIIPQELVAGAKSLAAKIPSISELGKASYNFLSSCGSSIASYCSGFGTGFSSLYTSIYDTCKSIYDTCTSIFSSLFCYIRQEEQQRQEEARFEAKQEEKRQDEKRYEAKCEENKHIAKANEEKRVTKAKEIEVKAVERKVEFELTKALPIARSMDHLQTQISAQMSAISQEIAKLSSCTNTSIWQSAKELNGKIAQLNNLTSELQHKQKNYELQVQDFNRSIDDLSRLRHRLSYNA